MRVPFYQHDLGDEEIASFAAVLRGSILTTGDTVAEFEGRFAELLRMPHAVGVTSCTAALHVALLASGVGPGDEVITTPMTFVATATAILQTGAQPVFADVEPDTGNLDVAAIEAALTPRTRAIVPVHLWGQMCDMRAIAELADRRGLTVIEDAAHCVEGARDGVGPGMLSRAACFSFYATKSLTSGEGGALVCRDAELAARLRLLRQQGMVTSAAERERHGYRHRDMVAMGWKYNMYNLQAALLLPQIGRVEARHRRRVALAERYAELLSDVDGVDLPAIRPGVRHAWHLLTIQVDARIRDAVVAGLQRAGIASSVHYYPPVHLTSFFRDALGYRAGSLPHAERLAERTISLPFYAAMPDEHVERVVESLAQVLDEAGSSAAR